jgi:hypothetical protein
MGSQEGKSVAFVEVLTIWEWTSAHDAIVVQRRSKEAGRVFCFSTACEKQHGIGSVKRRRCARNRQKSALVRSALQFHQSRA